MIYLSWSYFLLAGYLVGGIAAAVFFRKAKVTTAKQTAIGLACYALLIGYLAFDVGTRQQDLQRNRFDAQAPAAQEKVIRETMGRDDVKQTFENAVKETK